MQGFFEVLLLTFWCFLQWAQTIIIKLDRFLAQLHQTLHISQGKVELLQYYIAFETGQEWFWVLVDIRRVVEGLYGILTSINRKEELASDGMDRAVHGFLCDIGLQVLEGLFLLIKNKVTLGPIQIYLNYLLLMIENILKLGPIMQFILNTCLFTLRLLLLQLLRYVQHIVEIRVALLMSA